MGMATKKYDLVVKTGEWKDAQGNNKARWLNIGSMFQGDNGPFIVLDPWINLAGLPKNDRGTLFVSMFEPKNDRPGRPESSMIPAGDLNGDIPF
jgi:hypothetical protein